MESKKNVVGETNKVFNFNKIVTTEYNPRHLSFDIEQLKYDWLLLQYIHIGYSWMPSALRMFVKGKQLYIKRLEYFPVCLVCLILAFSGFL